MMEAFLISLLLLTECFLAFNTLYLSVFALAGKYGQADDSRLPASVTRFRRIALLIPAYREDAVIAESVRSHLTQHYPADCFDIIVIADSLRADTLLRLRELPVLVLEVSFVVSSVSKALREAFRQLGETDYEIAVVADADNHLAPDFLEKINRAFEAGWQAVQGHRVAKNLNTPVAVLDAINEEINNRIFRRGHRALGFACSIIGSGMGIEFGVMQGLVTRFQTMGGYDKELEMNLSLAGIVTRYLETALIYDEKVQDAPVFERQRTRWIAAQLDFLRLYFGVGLQKFLRGDWVKAEKIVQSLVVPKTLLLALLTAFSVVCALLSQGSLLALNLSLLLLLGFSLVLSVPTALGRLLSPRDLLLLPLLTLRLIRSLFRLGRARKSFLATPHHGEPVASTSAREV